MTIMCCKKTETPEYPPETQKPLTAVELTLVGKWKYQKTENYNASGTVTLTSIPAGVDTNAFINLTSAHYGNYATVYDHQHYTEYYGNTGQGSSGEWFLNSIVAGKQELFCNLYPWPPQSAYFYIDTITPNLLVVDNFTTVIPSGRRVYYYK